MKTLQEMNLMDDFLATSLISHKKYGEPAARYILECILRRPVGKLTVVSQQVMYGINPKARGIRMDVYLDEDGGEIFDLEPDQTEDVLQRKTLPRRTRFYHAKIDGANLKAGDKYTSLRNVIVIFITTYDPFELDRMVYTVKNCCIEEPGMPYDDGARTIYLYTRGTNGNPPEELRELLSYMEGSTEENAVSDALRKLHQMITAVKQDGEVGLAYMKSYELEEIIFEKGRKEGQEAGWKDGREAGKIEGTIMLCTRLGKGKDETIKLLCEELQLTETDAKKAYDKYAK